MNKNNNIETFLNTNGIMREHAIVKLNSNPDLIKEIAEYSLSDNPDSWRAVWILNLYLDRYGEQKIISQYSDAFIENLQKKIKDGHIREIIKLLTKIKLSEEQESEVFDYCYSQLSNNKIQASVRAVCFQFILNTSKKYPEITEEIEYIFNDIKNYLSRGIRSSIQNKIVKTKLLNNKK
ncbi:MAG: hypothetical protein WHW07_03355 [Bacteroidales bacterium]